MFIQVLKRKLARSRVLLQDFLYSSDKEKTKSCHKFNDAYNSITFNDAYNIYNDAYKLLSVRSAFHFSHSLLAVNVLFNYTHLYCLIVFCKVFIKFFFTLTVLIVLDSRTYFSF